DPRAPADLHLHRQGERVDDAPGDSRVRRDDRRPYRDVRRPDPSLRAGGAEARRRARTAPRRRRPQAFRARGRRGGGGILVNALSRAQSRAWESNDPMKRFHNNTLPLFAVAAVLAGASIIAAALTPAFAGEPDSRPASQPAAATANADTNANER